MQPKCNRLGLYLHHNERIIVEVMVNGKISVVRRTDRYITIAVDEWDEFCIKGVMFHCYGSNGIQFSSLMEMILNMDRVFDSVSCPKQTFQFRHFPGTNLPEFTQISEEKEREGKRNTFRVYVRYCYRASWQGLVHWHEGDQQEPFKSTLQMILIVNRMLKGYSRVGCEGETLKSFRVAIDAYDSGRIVGNYQNISAHLTERHDIPTDLAGTLGNFMDAKALKEKEVCSICRKSGHMATFSIKIMFREHSTYQGIIYWREGRVEQTFRSFKEMLYLILSAVGTLQANSGSYEEGVPSIALGI